MNPTGSTEGFYSAEVKVILADGSTGKYDVNLLASANKFGYTGSNSAKEKAMYTKVLTMKDTLVAYALDGSTITLIDPEFSTENYEFTNVSGDLGLKNSKASYVFGDGNLMADNKTVFFIKDKVGNYSVVNGLSNLRADAMVTTGTNQAIYYKLTMTAKALFATVNEEFTSNSNFAFVYGNYSSKTVGTDTVYTYPVVLEDGTITTLSSKTDKGVSKSAVHEYQVSGDYVTFDNQTGDIKNKLMVETVGNGTITVVDAETNALVGSYPVLSTAKIWNVEDVDATKADSVFTTSFQKYDKVALVFDTNDNIKTAYVYDRQDGEMTAPAAITLSAANGTLAADYATWTGVSAGDKLQVKVDFAAGQKVKVTSTVNGVKGTELDSTTDPAGIADNALADIYEATGSENNTKVVVTVTVSQDGYASRTKSFEVLVSGVRATAPNTVTVTAAAGTGGGENFFFGGSDKDSETVVAGTPLEANAIGRTGDETYAFTVAPAVGTKVESMKLNGEDYASGAKVAIPTTGEATYELVITVSQSGKVTTAYTYTVNLVNLQAVAGTIKMDTGASNGVGIGGSAVELKAGETTTVTTTDYSASGTVKTNVEINITNAGTGAVVSATLTGPDGLAKAYDLKSNASGDITLGAAAGTTTGETYTLTVVTGGNGYENVTTTYTILIKSAT